MKNSDTARRDTEDVIDVTITISRATFQRAWEIVVERDADFRPPELRHELTTVEDFLAWLIEQRLHWKWG
jgi:hypothetical protein